VARNNLRRQPVRALVALAALFSGVFAIGFSGAAISSQGKRVAAHRLPADGYNLAIYATAREEARLAALLGREGVGAIERRVTVPVAVRREGGAPLAPLRVATGLGRDRTGTVKVVEGGWPQEGAGALAPARLRGEPWRLARGEALEISAAGGERIRLPVAGFYEFHFVSPLVPRPEGVLVDAATARRLGGEAPPVTFVGQVPEDRLDRVAEALGKGVPESMVLSQADLNATLVHELESVYAFLVAVAGLALVAGAVLIANSVALAMLERRREMGIFKAIGYSSGRILAGIGLEYSLLGLLAGCAGMGAVAVAIQVINRLRPNANLALEPAQVPGMIVLATGIALASALVVAWRPTHVRPLEVLRQE
jgi:putative ABC transport system permease protein